ncbi:MAG: argininosuccinate synthase [Thermodesulfobacteriota bacterium]|nr:argininosuccinate synthase [Thermodesulfobacteriota bacterium]
MGSKVKKVVLAYSGGLDTSVILEWLIQTYDCDVVTYTADLGQEEELENLEEKAINTGAYKVYIEDLQEEFTREYIFPMLKANAVYEGGYLLGTSIARPIIAKKQIEIAKKENADAVCHGATGKGNDQVRFELTYLSLDPQIKIIAPWREWELSSRKSLIAYAEKYKIPVTITEEKPYSCDRNLFHISFEGGILEDPWAEPDEEMYLLSVSPEKAPDKATYVEIDFESGIPVAVNGEKKSPANLMKHLNELGGKNGIGRLDIVENRYVGMKSRGVYETPGGTILHIAHKAMESITMDREVMHFRDSLIPKYSELIYYGYWFSPETELLKKTIDETQKDVSGTIRLKLYKGNCLVTGRKSNQSLYRHDFATFEEDAVYNQRDAEGFIRTNALRLRIHAMKR